MRILITTPPGLAHLFPLVPLAHAAQTAGHEVLVANGGSSVDAAVRAGLAAVDVTPDRDVEAPYEQLAEAAKDLTLSPPELMTQVGTRFGQISELMLDGIVRAARRWRADAVLYPPALPAGLLAARIVGIPAILHGFGLRRPTLEPAMRWLSEAAAEWGVQELPRDPDLEVNISPSVVQAASATPDSVRTAPPTGETLDMRYCPNNGGAKLPWWLFEDRPRPRVAVTLGSLSSTAGEGELLAAVVRGAEKLDVELVLTPVPADLAALPKPLPDYVRRVDWLPVSTLLRGCDAIVHHGGMGTTFVAFAAGVPQLIVPHLGDQPYNARVVEQCGAGTSLRLADATPQSVEKVLGQLLDSPGYLERATAIATEMAAMPSPHEVIARVAEVIGEKRSAR
ncbi:glycosyltransferase [Amycolatopsis umgeniensis]|uniref:Glycosyltransferase n=1 Tax=Amycolatopsis umgeniensis TaxID=336628 RepID=A0A841BG68_9PSEU|nr:glycosyltransferase [Amycolatopsis umgeniensis]MBB5857504.1 glycosyltransferase [Amycolatopsis umgeniensis]